MNTEDIRTFYAFNRWANHRVPDSSYHRGQVVVLPRQLGRLQRATDFLLFLDEGGETRVR